MSANSTYSNLYFDSIVAPKTNQAKSTKQSKELCAEKKSSAFIDSYFKI